MFLRIYPFFPDCQVFWHIAVCNSMLLLKDNKCTPLYVIIVTYSWERRLCKPSEMLVWKFGGGWGGGVGGRRAFQLLSMSLTLKIVGLQGPLGRCQGACTARVQAQRARATKASLVLNSPRMVASWCHTPATYRGSPGPQEFQKGLASH